MSRFPVYWPLSIFLLLLFFSPYKVLSRTKHKDSNKYIVNRAIILGKLQKEDQLSQSLCTKKFLLSHSNVRSENSIQKTLTVSGGITLTVTTMNSTCGYSNGSMIVVASGGIPPYSFDIGDGLIYKTGNFPGLIAGNYKVTVTDNIGQTNSVDVVLGNTYSKIDLQASSYKLASACGAADASITLQASGGLPPYEYSMDGVNYQTSNVFSNFYPGLYNFFVRDANGCTATLSSFYQSHFIPHFCEATGWGYTSTACADDGAINVQGLGSDKPYRYSIDGVNYQLSQQFSNLKAGMYTVYLKGAKGSMQVMVVPIYQSCNIKIDYISVDAACQQNDGTLTVFASYGTAPYSYTLDGVNYQSGNEFTGLATGYYNITVKDANGTTNSMMARVYDHCPLVSSLTYNETCTKNDGAIHLYATKGTPPYQYSIDGINFQTSEDFTGLAAGTYTVTLKDAYGFTAQTIAIVNNICLKVSAQSVDAKCGDSNGSINANAGNGTAPYQYSIDGTKFQSSGTFNSLAPGNYTVTAKDASGKTGTTTVKIFDIPGPIVGITTSFSSCSDNDGSVTLTGSGGMLPFSFSTDGTNFQSNNIFNNLKSGSYTAYVKDGNGCISSKAFVIDMNCPLVTAVVADETCNSKNGTISVSGSKGTPPYQYSIDGINFTTSQIFSSLSLGNYTITIKDAAGIKNTTSVNIKNICPQVTASVTDGKCTEAGGIITAQGSDGYSPYQYSIDGINFQQSNVFNSLPDGDYSVTIKDSRGLINTTKATIKNFPSPVMSVVSTPATCINNDGQILISNSGGTSPFTYRVDGSSFQPGNTFSKLSAATYNVIIKDAYGCTDTKQSIVELNDNLVISTDKRIDLCEGESATLTVSSNAMGFDWSPVKNISSSNIQNPTVSPTQTTQYLLTATLGVCSRKDSVLVRVNPAPIAIAQKDTTICYGQSVTLSGNGGFCYEWVPSTFLDNSSSSNPVVLTPKSSITYSLIVTDSKGCSSLNTAFVKITVTLPVKLFAGNDTSIVMNEPFQLLARDINNSGFVNYSWSPPDGLSNTSIQNPVTILDHNVVYTVVAYTQAGCEGSDEISVKVFRGPDIFVPNAFTPNGDGKNDVLRPIPIGIKQFKYFIVYNRYGEKIFYSINPNQGWDGCLKNELQKTDVFVWAAEGIDDKGKVIRRKGTVVIIR